MKSLYSALALTAAVSYAESSRLAELLSLQSTLLDHMDLGHTEPEVDHKGDSKHVEHIEHFNDIIHTDTHGQCPLGYVKMGCCKCIADIDRAARNVSEHHSDYENPTIHGSHYGYIEHEEHEINDAAKDLREFGDERRTDDKGYISDTRQAQTDYQK